MKQIQNKNRVYITMELKRQELIRLVLISADPDYVNETESFYRGAMLTDIDRGNATLTYFDVNWQNEQYTYSVTWCSYAPISDFTSWLVAEGNIVFIGSLTLEQKVFLWEMVHNTQESEINLINIKQATFMDPAYLSDVDSPAALTASAAAADYPSEIIGVMQNLLHFEARLRKPSKLFLPSSIPADNNNP